MKIYAFNHCRVSCIQLSLAWRKGDSSLSTANTQNKTSIGKDHSWGGRFTCWLLITPAAVTESIQGENWPVSTKVRFYNFLFTPSIKGGVIGITPSQKDSGISCSHQGTKPNAWLQPLPLHMDVPCMLPTPLWKTGCQLCPEQCKELDQALIWKELHSHQPVSRVHSHVRAVRFQSGMVRQSTFSSTTGFEQCCQLRNIRAARLDENSFS